MTDAVNLAIGISLLPIVIVFLMWFFLRKHRSKKETNLVLGFLCMIAVYVFLPIPSVVEVLYAQGGSLDNVFVYSGIAAVFLFLSIWFFKQHLGD